MATEGASGAGGEAVAAELDVTGQRCPIPVLKAKKRMKALAPGAVLLLTADDPVAVLDVANWCREDGHELVARTDAEAGGWHFLVRKGGGQAIPT